MKISSEKQNKKIDNSLKSINNNNKKGQLNQGKFIDDVEFVLID